MVARFLFKAQLWEELEARIPRAKRVRAAIAYLGTGGSKLLPLREGDELVVDMSLRAVRSGVTNPSEVKRLLRRKVKVFSRETLHAKFLIIDRVVIAGSSNISSHAKNTLDEAAVLTDDPAVLRRAVETFVMLCTKPVRKEYLAKCLSEYRPPTFGAGDGRRRRQTRVRDAQAVWLVGPLEYFELPESEEQQTTKALQRVRKMHAYEKTVVECSHADYLPGAYSKMREGDWLITCVKRGRTYDVFPPAQFLGLRAIPLGGRKTRHLLVQESPAGTKPVSWGRFRPSVARTLSLRDGPRTAAIYDAEKGDTLLRLWDDAGKWRGPRR